MASASPSSRATKHQVFLSFRGEDTRYNFTGDLLKALKDTGINVSFDIKEKVEKEDIPQALSDEIAASNLSIIVLSKGYASSKLCLAELSVIMDRKRSQGHVVLPIFYHVDPSHVPNISERHKSKKWPDDALKRCQSAFVEVSKLKGWHIEGGKFDRPETEHIKDIVESVKQKLKTKHRVFLSLGEDTRLNFTSHLLKALKGKDISVFFDEEKVENGGKLSPALSQAIATSNLSIVVLSKDYTSSKSCRAELSDIMDRKSNHGQIVLPIFYHFDPFNDRNFGESFKTSFPEVGKLKGWHIGGKFNRPETEYIKEIVEYVTKELTNSNSISSKELVGVYDWKKMISSVIGKTTLDDAIYEEVSTKFEDRYFLQDVSGKIEKQRKESSSLSCQLKHQVFLSFRGEDTRLNFISHLLEALKEKGVNVFLDEEKLERGEQLSLTGAIAASNLSIVILSENYAASKSCLAELSDIMYHKRTQGHIVLPIFYKVDPSDVRRLGGCFKPYFEVHESKGPVDEVKRWKAAFVEVSKLKGWHIEGGIFDRPEAEYIKDIVKHAIKTLMNNEFTSSSEEFVGLDDQKKKILGLIEQKDCRIIGLWGMGGIGKTTLADAVYNSISPKFQSCYFLQNVRQKIEEKGLNFIRNELLSKLLDDKIDIVTASIGSSFIQRLNCKRVIVVLDDVINPDHIDYMGVKYFGDGSKIIITSRDRQVLKNVVADKIYEVKRLNESESLQLFSIFAFKQLNPDACFRDVSIKFVKYAQGIPLALKILGSKLYNKSRIEWESEVDRLNQYAEPRISQILRSSFDGLDELEKNVFLDIAYFLKGESKENVEEILSCIYEGARIAISNLIDKCLLDITSFDIIDGYRISMYDTLEVVGKDIIRQEAEDPEKCSRLWVPKDVYQVLKYNKGTESIEGIKLNMSRIDNLWLCPSAFENMLNLRYIHFYDPHWMSSNKKLYIDGDDIVSLPNELRYLLWDYYPFKSLPSSFNPKNLVVLRFWSGKMEQLWNENDCQGLWNLREIDVSYSRKLRKIPNLLGAINLKILLCWGCESLAELPNLDRLASLETLGLSGCKQLSKIPNLLGAINLKILCCNQCESLAELPSLDHLEFLERLEVSGCKNLREIPNLLGAINLKIFCCNQCESLVELPRLNHWEARKESIYMLFSNCFSLNQDSIRNIEANAKLQIQSLGQRWASRELRSDSRLQKKYFCCFPGNEISENDFEYRSMNSSLNLNIDLNGCSGSKFLAFAICLVSNITCGNTVAFICKYQLKAASGEMFNGECRLYFDINWSITGDHVLILFSEDVIRRNHEYDKASFEVNIESIYGGEEIEVDIKVEKCGVHVFYVDAESDDDIEEVAENFDPQEYSEIEEVQDDFATKMRPSGHKRSFGYEGDRVPKRWK